MDTLIGIGKAMVLGILALLVGLGVWTLVKVVIAIAARRKANGKAVCKTGAASVQKEVVKETVVA